MPKKLRILVGLGIAVAAIGSYLLFFGVQTFFIWETRRVARKQPVVWTMPAQLSDLSVSRASGKRLSYFGYEFEVPWDDIDQERTRVIGTNKAIIAFRSGNAISFWCGTPDELMRNLQDGGKINQRDLAQLLGSEAVRSDYAFKSAILDITPASFSLFTPKRRAIQLGTLFTMKAVVLPPGAESGLFFVSTKEFKGFQYGRTQNPPRHLSVELFKSDGHVDIMFGQKVNGPTVISQSDVNLIVQSLRQMAADGMVPVEGSHK